MPQTIAEPSGAYLSLSRDHWAKLSSERNLRLTEETLQGLLALGDPVHLDDVRQVYLPLAELIGIHIDNNAALSTQRNGFLGLNEPTTPFIIGIAGSVAVGKSTVARLLRELLGAYWRVDLVTTDGFLYPNAVLAAKGLMERKGFPRSYDQARLTAFVRDVKSGVPEVVSPVYSHLTYDIVPDQVITVRQPEVLIIEGLNVLQPPRHGKGGPVEPTVSDYFDFSVYVDAPETAIKQWFLDRFQHLRQTAFTDPASYFNQYADLPWPVALGLASEIWDTINGPNLRRNILPTRERASLVIGKGADHNVESIRLRKV